jgi:hypothetical protein
MFVIFVLKPILAKLSRVFRYLVELEINGIV